MRLFKTLSLVTVLSITSLQVAQAQVASYYGKGFHGKRTASGEIFNQNSLTAAHNSLPFGSKVRVTNRANGKSVIVKINDRGGFGKYGRSIDLSKGAAQKIGMLKSGVGKVNIEVLSRGDGKYKRL